MKRHTVCLLLGSNIDPATNLVQAVNLLASQLTLLQSSSVWQSPSVGSSGPDYLNAAVTALTDLDAQQLKQKVLHPTEAALGRVRTENKFADRTLDIDLILFDGQVVDEDALYQSHCVVPISEIMPSYIREGGKMLKDIAVTAQTATPIWVRSDVSGYPFSTVF